MTAIRPSIYYKNLFASQIDICERLVGILHVNSNMFKQSTRIKYTEDKLLEVRSSLYFLFLHRILYNSSYLVNRNWKRVVYTMVSYNLMKSLIYCHNFVSPMINSLN